ncbi:ABC transporter ATP-binding protein [Alphaproteobacteria bacterium]|nr:ABC transporter ATP-binding protein [Alphaproteobacteria bacterium]
MAKITVENIVKSFGQTKVLNDVSLAIEDGEFVSLVGPSGCGKSTLLRILAGLEPQNSGNVVIDTRTVNNVAASDRDLAMVFQSYALYPHLSVRDNLTVPLRLRDMSFWQRLALIGRFVPGSKNKMNAIKQDVNGVADMLKITELLDRKPGQLSGGQRQRVAVGRAMVRNPVAFLMDEPLSNLDAALRVHMRAEIAELHRHLKATFVYVTHDQAEALTMSDRIAVMMGGNILQFDTPTKVYTDPRNRRVAEFIGSPKMNMIPATIDKTGKVSIDHGGSTPVRASGAVGSAFLGIRPENLSLATGAKAHLHAVTRHIENLGSELYIHCQVGDGTETIIARAEMNQMELVTPGRQIGLALNYEKVFLFGHDDQRIDIKGSA